MPKYFATMVFGLVIGSAALFGSAPAQAYDSLCGGNPDPSARIKCWRSSPAFDSYVPAQAAARCPDKSMDCFYKVLDRWASCMPYAQAAGVAYNGTKGFTDQPPGQWPATVQNVDATLTSPPYGPQSMKPNYAPLITAQGFAEDNFGASPAEVTSYMMNMCLDNGQFQ